MRRALLSLCLLMGALTGCDDDGPTVTRSPYDLAPTPVRFDFGSVAVGVTAESIVRVQNVGNGSAELTGVSIGGSGGGAFVLPEGWTGTLEGNGGLQEFTVQFTPQAEGWVEDSLLLQVTSQDNVEVVSIPIRGAGVEDPMRVWPEVLDFGPVADGDEEDRDVTLENLTDADLEIAQANFSGDDLGFAFEAPSEPGELPFFVPARDRVEASVTFEATSSEAQEAELAFADGDGYDWGVELELRVNLCEGSSEPGWDGDGDGYTPCGGDCLDDDPGSHPGASELEDGVDNDCDGTIDEGTNAYDDDGDGYSENDGDCDDNEPTTSPDAEEVPDGRDNDCDGAVDEGTTADDTDADGWTSPAGDCDEGNGTVYPGAQELEDGLDNDCDGTVDETTTIYDDDGDGYCDNGSTCIAPWQPGDCNDADPGAFPGGTEVVNGIDDDCNGIVDDGTPAFDNDGDGYTQLGGDCDDSDSDTYPGAAEQPDSIDNDCDGTIDEGTAFFDDDGDGFTENGGDCNDSSPLVFPGAAEDLGSATPDEGDGIDNDCDTLVDEGTLTYDDDGDGFSELGGDCDDGNDDFSPGEYDPPGDGIDWDCDGNDD